MTLSVGFVQVPFAEPALADDLSEAMAGALARRGALGAGPVIDLVVEGASDDRVAVDLGGRSVHVVRLRVACQVSGAQPGRLVVAGQRSYTLTSDDALGAAAHRAAAYRILARELAQDAVDWLLYAPSSPTPAGHTAVSGLSADGEPPPPPTSRLAPSNRADEPAVDPGVQE